MKTELLRLAMATLELWEEVNQLDPVGLFGQPEKLFDKEPACVKMARDIVKNYGG